MEKLRIHSGHKLYGSLDICSSKNAILPMLAGSVLCDGKVTLNKIPNLDINDDFAICNEISKIIIEKNSDLKTQKIWGFFVSQ